MFLLGLAMLLPMAGAGCRALDAQAGTLTGSSQVFTVTGRYTALSIDQVASVTIAAGKLVVSGTSDRLTLELPAGADPSKVLRRWALTTELDTGSTRSVTFTHAETIEEFTVELPQSDAELRYGVFEGPSGADVMVIAWGRDSKSYLAHLVITRKSGAK